MIRLPEYSKPVAEYKPEAQLILGKPCYAQEKFDGSQFTFAYIEGQFYARSRGQQMAANMVPELFASTYEAAKGLCETGKLAPNLLYRCEAFKGPKHNTLKYDRAPKHGFVVYDVQDAITQQFWTCDQLITLWEVCEQAAFEETELVFTTRAELVEWAAAHAYKQSRLGGAVEGFVFKEHSSSPDRACVKVVRDEFKELHKSNEEYSRTSSKSGLDKVLAALAGPARYTKALSHAREAGLLKGAMQDMPTLLQEVNADLDADNADIQQLLWDVFGKEIKRYVGGGLALWYKSMLREQ